MDAKSVVNGTDKKYKEAIDHFRSELNKLRTGRANPSMLDSVKVTAYGTPMPLIQVGSITVAEPQLLQITPFDPANLTAISTAIRENQSLGLNPMDDGRVIRIPIPPLTTERRQLIVKQLHTKVEESMVSLRNARHEGMKELDLAKKDGDIGEDEHKRLSSEIDSKLQATKSQIDEMSKGKEAEIMKA